jgi:transposase
MNEGYRWKKKLFSQQGRGQLEKLALAPWVSRRRQELLELLDRLNPTIEELTAAAEQEARKRPDALRLMTHPGGGPLTALAYVLIIGTPSRFEWQTDRQLRGHDSHRGLQWRQAATGTHQQARRRKLRLGTMRTGDVGTCTWRCVGTRASCP